MTVSRTGCVYFARVGRRGPIKIGWTSDLDHRMGYMRTDHWEEVTILAVLHGGTMADEAALHRAFASTRIRGEWFRSSKKLLRLCETIEREQLEARLTISNSVLGKK